MNIEHGDGMDERTDAGRSSVEATLDLLSAIGSGSPFSQRSLAGRLGVALGLANALIRRCVKKGFIKISTAPARRYAYYLTPAGFAEKSRLVGEYVESSLSFFRSARAEFTQVFATATAAGFRRIVLVGSGELAEIALLAAEDSGIALVGVIDSTRNVATFHGLPIFRHVGEAGDFDAILLTSAHAAQETYDRLTREVATERILAPALLHIAPPPDGERP